MYNEKIQKLVEANKENKPALDLIHEVLVSFGSYIKSVNDMENCIKVLRFRLEPEEYRERLEYLDRNRSIIHNGVIDGVNVINRLCKRNEMPPFFSGNITDRVQVAEFAKAVVDEVWKNRKK